LLLSHNLEHRLLEHGRWQERLFAPWLRRIEASVPQRYQGVLTCADDDRRFFAQHDPHGSCRLAPVGCAVDPGAYRAPPGARERLRAELGIGDDETVFLFSGSRFQPNVDALAWLRALNARDPGFLTKRRVRVLVVGTVSPEAWREGGVIATGRVPDMTPYFAASDAGLNPITWGSGANIKLFEYIAARLPVMSTCFGVRGIELEPGRDYHAFEPGTFAERLDAWLATRDRAAWRALADEVWTRHQASVDIHQVVRRAIDELPALSG
ncbi:MAG: glycosyltransferase family 4 protein, partial [Panacagrimonas sp.]